MSLIKYRNKRQDPFREAFQFPSIWDPIMNFGWDEPSMAIQDGNLPAIDISEDKDHVYVKMDLPGFDKKDIKIDLHDGYLTVEAERKSEVDSKDKTYHRVERSYGLYRRSIQVGTHVDESQIKAKYTDGVLDLSLPKSGPKDVKKIAIE